MDAPQPGEHKFVDAIGTSSLRNCFNMYAAGSSPFTRQLPAIAVRGASPIRFSIKGKRLIVVKRKVSPETDSQLNDIALPTP